MTNQQLYLGYAVIVAVLMFFGGVLYADWHYKDIPTQQLVSMRSTQEIDTQTKLIQCKALANSIVAKDAEIITTTYDLIGDKKLPQDRVQDVENIVKARQPILDRLNAL